MFSPLFLVCSPFVLTSLLPSLLGLKATLSPPSQPLYPSCHSGLQAFRLDGPSDEVTSTTGSRFSTDLTVYWSNFAAPTNSTRDLRRAISAAKSSSTAPRKPTMATINSGTSPSLLRPDSLPMETDSSSSRYSNLLACFLSTAATGASMPAVHI